MYLVYIRTLFSLLYDIDVIVLLGGDCSIGFDTCSNYGPNSAFWAYLSSETVGGKTSVDELNFVKII